MRFFAGAYPLVAREKCRAPGVLLVLSGRPGEDAAAVPAFVASAV
jgi:hypothetical protein